jgi:methyl-accepting chemotaxis protein
MDIYVSLLIIMSVIIIVLSYIIRSQVAKPVKELVSLAEKVSLGDVSFEISNTNKDELGKLSGAFADMKSVLVSLTDEIGVLTNAASNGKLDIRGNSNKFSGKFADIIDGFNGTLNEIIKPLNVTAEYVDRISKGDIPIKIEDEYKGDFNEIKNNINQLIDSLNLYINDVAVFIDEHKKGDLDCKIDSNKFNGDFAKMARGSNEAVEIYVDAIKEILNVVSKYSNGDFSVLIRQFPGKQALANDVVNQVKYNIENVVKEVNELSTQMNLGNLDRRAHEEQYEGAFKEMISGLNQTLDAVINPLNISAEYVARISKGDIPQKIEDEAKGDFNELKNNLNTLIDTLNFFVEDMTHMSTQHIEGRIDVYMQEEKFMGVFQTMAKGMNDTVKDHIAGVLRILEVVDEYGKGNFDLEMEEMKGQRIIATQRTRKFRQNLLSVQNELDKLAKAAEEGDLDVRAEYSQFEGGWQDIIKGANSMLHNAATPISEFVEILSKVVVYDLRKEASVSYNGDWAKLANSINTIINELRIMTTGFIQISKGDLSMYEDLKKNPQYSDYDELNPASLKMFESILALTNDTVQIAKEAANGNFEVRADLSKFEGEYRNVMQGLNDVVEAFVSPLNLSMDYFANIASGKDLAIIDTKDYKGGFKELTSNINKVAEFMNNVTSDIALTANAAVEGKLSTRINTEKYPGTWKDITEGINQILDSIIKPINEAMQILEVMSKGDFTLSMQGNYKGDHAKLKSSINSLVEALNNLVYEISEAANNVSQSAISISQTTDTISAASHEQSSQVDEVAAAMEEMARTITENSTNAATTAEYANNNGKIAEEGGHVVANTINKMREIAEVVNQSAKNIERLGQSSTQIGEIISVIEEIADQTNLLALNAAIEAARAGEQGRGFAVVADEVRKLAERTTEATKQISTMIKGIQAETSEAVHVMHKGNEEVSEGISLADNAGVALQEVVNSTKNVLQMINSIAASSEEQAATSEEISKNINTISIATNESAQSIESIAQSSDDLTGLTRNLTELVSNFKIRGASNKNKLQHSNVSRERNMLADNNDIWD